jgi:hypothetical protein
VTWTVSHCITLHSLRTARRCSAQANMTLQQNDVSHNKCGEDVGVEKGAHEQSRARGSQRTYRWLLPIYRARGHTPGGLHSGFSLTLMPITAHGSCYGFCCPQKTIQKHLCHSVILRLRSVCRTMNLR